MFDSEALLKELLETFRLEAQDHLGALSTLLVELENLGEPAGQNRLVESIFRRMHTLKGAAHAVNLPEIAQSCQELENLLADLKRGDIALELALFDRLHADIDSLSEQIFGPPSAANPAASAAQTASAAPGTPPTPGAVPTAANGAIELPASAGRTDLPVADLPHPPLPGQPLRKPEQGVAPEPKENEPPAAQGNKAASGDTVRVSTRLLASLLLQAEELVSAKLAASALAEEVAAAAALAYDRANDRSRALELARESLRKTQPDAVTAKLAALVQESCQAELQIQGRLRLLEKAAEKHLWNLGGMVDPLLDEMKKLHLLPFSSLTEPFSKLVRDIARELDKEAELSCLGAEIEIDRRILAELKEPLLHIVRNMMDHGIEKQAERRLKGKPDRGRISIEIRLQDANRAEVVIADDGRGIDLAQVKGAALRLELATREALDRMPDADALQFIFESGISTSPMITTLSGRGVGLAIVRESLEKLGGHATVESRAGEGTRFRLCLPLSFAMMRGLLVETSGRACMVPSANVELTARVARSEIRSVENRDTVVIAGEVISLVSLARLLEVEEKGARDGDGFQSIMLLNGAEKRIAFAVDQVLGVHEILVKPLGSLLSRVRNVAGATVLGNGSVVPILNIGDLFRSALLVAASGLGGVPPDRPKPKRLSVLVAEDSITSRTLLKNILEASGFQVRTAIDGADALAQLKTESFDVIVSDVEMPRLDGFELTAAIRADPRLAHLPVILVTGLESRADRERGIDVGASAYIVKSSFDQSSLVEVVQKLT